MSKLDSSQEEDIFAHDVPKRPRWSSPGSSFAHDANVEEDYDETDGMIKFSSCVTMHLDDLEDDILVGIFFDQMGILYNDCLTSDDQNCRLTFIRASRYFAKKWRISHFSRLVKPVRKKLTYLLLNIGPISSLIQSSSHENIVSIAFEAWRLGLNVSEGIEDEKAIAYDSISRKDVVAVIFDGLVFLFKKRRKQVFNDHNLLRILLEMYKIDKGRVLCSVCDSSFRCSLAKLKDPTALTARSVSHDSYVMRVLPLGDPAAHLEFFVELIHNFTERHVFDADDEVVSQRFPQMLCMLQELQGDAFTRGCASILFFMQNHGCGVWDSRRKRLLTNIVTKNCQLFEDVPCAELVSVLSSYKESEKFTQKETSVWKDSLMSMFKGPPTNAAPLQLLHNIFESSDAWNMVRSIVLRRILVKTQKYNEDMPLATFLNFLLTLIVRVNDWAELLNLTCSFAEKSFTSTKDQRSQRLILKFLDVLDIIAKDKVGLKEAFQQVNPKGKLLISVDLAVPSNAEIFVENVLSLPNLESLDWSRVMSLREDMKMRLFHRLSVVETELSAVVLWEEALKFPDEGDSIEFIRRQMEIGVEKKSTVVRERQNLVLNRLKNEKALPHPNLLFLMAKQLCLPEASKYCDTSALVHLWIIGVCSFMESHDLQIYRMTSPIWSLVQASAIDGSAEMREILHESDSFDVQMSPTDYMEKFFQVARAANTKSGNRIENVRVWMKEPLKKQLILLLNSTDERVKERTARVVCDLLYWLGTELVAMIPPNGSHSNSVLVALLSTLFKTVKALFAGRKDVAMSSPLAELVDRATASLVRLQEKPLIRPLQIFVLARLRDVADLLDGNRPLLEKFGERLAQPMAQTYVVELKKNSAFVNILKNCGVSL